MPKTASQIAGQSRTKRRHLAQALMRLSPLIDRIEAADVMPVRLRFALELDADGKNPKTVIEWSVSDALMPALEAEAKGMGLTAGEFCDAMMSGKKDRLTKLVKLIGGIDALDRLN